MDKKMSGKRHLLKKFYKALGISPRSRSLKEVKEDRNTPDEIRALRVCNPDFDKKMIQAWAAAEITDPSGDAFDTLTAGDLHRMLKDAPAPKMKSPKPRSPR